MNKRKVLLSCIIIVGVVLISGCTTTQRPPGYPSRYDDEGIDVELNYENPIFYFGDVVQDDGSVNKTKTVTWTLVVNNYGSSTEEIHFKIIKFPTEVLMWHTTLALYQRTSDNLMHIDGSITMTFEIELEYGADDEDFDRIQIEGIKSNTSTELIFSITLNEAEAWSYSPDTTYIGQFEIGRRTINPKCNNIGYDELFIPFVVRT